MSIEISILDIGPPTRGLVLKCYTEKEDSVSSHGLQEIMFYRVRYITSDYRSIILDIGLSTRLNEPNLDWYLNRLFVKVQH